MLINRPVPDDPVMAELPFRETGAAVRRQGHALRVAWRGVRA